MAYSPVIHHLDVETCKPLSTVEVVPSSLPLWLARSPVQREDCSRKRFSYASTLQEYLLAHRRDANHLTSSQDKFIHSIEDRAWNAKKRSLFGQCTLTKQVQDSTCNRCFGVHRASPAVVSPVEKRSITILLCSQVGLQPLDQYLEDFILDFEDFLKQHGIGTHINCSQQTGRRCTVSPHPSVIYRSRNEIRLEVYPRMIIPATLISRYLLVCSSLQRKQVRSLANHTKGILSQKNTEYETWDYAFPWQLAFPVIEVVHVVCLLEREC